MLSKLFQQSDIPKEYHSNFIHLYFDIAWFGVLSGSAINFLSVYATRLGATGLQIGMLGAVAAIVSLMIAIPASHWIEQRHTGRAVFSASVYYRLGFLLWIFLPWIFTDQQQIWALIVITFLMAIPFTPLSVGFNALFAASVPTQYRAHVAGIRNVTLAITYMATSLLSGYLLKTIPFPIGYQIVFAIGFFGAAMSSLHLYFIKPLQAESTATQTAPAPAPVSQARSTRGIFSVLRLDIWSTPFRNVLLALFAFHLTHYPHHSSLSALQRTRPAPQRQQSRHRHSALLPDHAHRLDTIQARCPSLRQQKCDCTGRDRHGAIPLPAGFIPRGMAILRNLISRRLHLGNGRRRVCKLHARTHPAR